MTEERCETCGHVDANLKKITFPDGSSIGVCKACATRIGRSFKQAVKNLTQSRGMRSQVERY